MKKISAAILFGLLSAAGCSPASGASINSIPFIHATLSAASGTIANTETQVISLSIPANSVRVGTTFQLHAGGLFTNTTAASSSVFDIRYGTSSLSGAIAASLTSANGTTARTNIVFNVDAEIVVTAIGASGTALGWINMNLGNAVIPVISGMITVAVTVDTTATKLVELTYISGATTTTANFLAAHLEEQL